MKIRRFDDPVLFQEKIQDWFAKYIGEALDEEPDPAHVKKQVTRYLGSDLLMRGLKIWEKKGVPVSMAGYAGQPPTASGWVWCIHPLNIAKKVMPAR